MHTTTVEIESGEDLLIYSASWYMDGSYEPATMYSPAEYPELVIDSVELDGVVVEPCSEVMERIESACSYAYRNHPDRRFRGILKSHQW